MAERVSLSPNLISETARVSFSLTIGITPISRSSLMVLTALRYWERCGFGVSWVRDRGGEREGDHTSAISFRVSRIWAMGWRSWSNSLSHRLMSRHCPIAAKAWDMLAGLSHTWDHETTDLDAGQMLRPLREIHPAQSHANGARGDEYHPMSILM